MTLVLVGLLLVSTFTDIRHRKIYNWTTYPGMIVALLISGIATWMRADVINGPQTQADTLGILTWPDSLFGLLACGAMMIVCYVFFPGGVGGGDVKLIAMIGAYLGVMSGLEAMLWTFVLGGCGGSSHWFGGSVFGSSWRVHFERRRIVCDSVRRSS